MGGRGDVRTGTAGLVRVERPGGTEGVGTGEGVTGEGREKGGRGSHEREGAGGRHERGRDGWTAGMVREKGGGTRDETGRREGVGTREGGRGEG